MSLPRLTSFIHGRYLEPGDGETFEVLNPATGDAIYEVEMADEATVNAAVRSAQQGFAIWSAHSAPRGRASA